MKLPRIGLWVVGPSLCLGPGCTTYKLEPTPGAAVFSDQHLRPIPAAVSVPATIAGASLLDDETTLEFVGRLQQVGLFERVHYAGRSDERGVASVELYERKKQEPVNPMGQLAKVFLVTLSFGATAPITTYQEEWRMDWTISVSRHGDLVKTYTASTTVRLKHRGLPPQPNSATAKAWQAAREQLWSQLLGTMAADREFLAAALVAGNKLPDLEVLP